MSGLTHEPSGDRLGKDEWAALLDPLRAAPSLLLAVSGGPDSTALMHMAAAARQSDRLPALVVATVDHGLQAASLEVAAGVLAGARALGLEARLLRWDGPKPGTALQEAARAERYRLLDGFARDLGGAWLVTAHTLDDQAETILFRLARGSGPAGLAGMRPLMRRQGIAHARPFLAVLKRRLIATCVAAGWPFVEDVANRDLRFGRTRMRRLLPALADEGLDAEAFARLGRRLARDVAALDAYGTALAGAATLPSAIGRKALDPALLLASPPAVSLRALASVLSEFARGGPPPLGGLERLEQDLRHAHAAERILRRTLHGHIVSLGAGRIDIMPEGPRRRGVPSPCDESR